MIYIPAIDIKDNRCVRLYKDGMQVYKVYKNSPIEVIDEIQLDASSIPRRDRIDRVVCSKLINFNLN